MEREPTALVVDDEPDIRELMERTLNDEGVKTITAPDLAAARRLLAMRPFDLCFTDLRLPDGSGIELVREIQQKTPAPPIAVISAHGNMETAIEALKAGAFDFVTKPVDPGGLRTLIHSALRLIGDPRDRRSRDILIGDSRAMRSIRSMIVKLARSQAPVYISGESGTGKELVARLIHERSHRADAPFVPVNCGAMPAELIDSELFGHRKGSFTGAMTDKAGLFLAADGGTLLLDEVAELPLALQVKLLRAIQEKAIRPVGAEHEVPVDVRILSATHQDLRERVRAGKFRKDLYYRINVIELHVPSLREHREDIPRLAVHFLERIGNRIGTRLELADDAMAALQAYAFPGNVRELENILERAATLCDGQRLHARDLRLADLAANDPSIGEPELDLESYLANVEKEAIVTALEQTRYNKTAAARNLGISFRALRYRLKKLGIE